MQDFPCAFLNTFGDFNFAFTGQQFHRAHFAHVHAHRVGGAAGLALYRGENSGSFFGGNFVGAVSTFLDHQLIGIGGFFHHGDAHVVDHLNDVFHLIGVGNGLRQVVIHFGVGQVTLFLAERDQLLQLGLLLLLLSRHAIKPVTSC